jgi:hypothetical protein
MSFASGGSELRGGMLSMLDTHIVMSSLIFRLVLVLIFHLAFTLVLRLALFHVVCLSSLIDLTIAHIVLVHERTALILDALGTAHVLIVVIIFPRRPGFPAGVSFPHFESRHLDGSHFPRRGSRPS